LCSSKVSEISESKVYIDVDSASNVLEILRYFNLSWDKKETDIEKLVKDKQINTTEGVCLILEIL
jgi:hypothetical protein